MSIRTMSAVWDSDKYDGGALLVLLAMADYADEDHVCRPSVRGLARKSRLSERQVIRILNGFKADGTIAAIGEHKARPGRPIVIYQIKIDALRSDAKVTLASPLDDAKGDTMSPLDDAKGDIFGAKVTPASPSKVTLMSYDPSLGPPIDTPIEEGAAAPTAAAAEPPAWYESDPEPEPQPTTVPVTAKTLTQQPIIAMYRDVFLRFPSKAQMNWLLAQDVAELRRWREVLELWVGKGWAATNLSGMVDLYRNPQRIQELRTYQGGANAITTNRATNDRRAKGGAGGVLGGSPGYPAGGYPNGRANAAAFDARPTAALVETDDDGEDIYL